MTDLVVVLAMGAITYGSRVTFLVHQGPVPSGILRRFLDRFPLALFVSLAASILIGPGSDVDLRFGLAAIAGGVGGGGGPHDPKQGLQPLSTAPAENTARPQLDSGRGLAVPWQS
jgi:hypothetical protein